MNLAKSLFVVLTMLVMVMGGIGCNAGGLPPSSPGTSAVATPISDSNEAEIQPEASVLVTYDDPYAYCAAVGTIDQPNTPYTGEDMPEAIIHSMIAQELVSADAPPEIQQNGVWRCMNNQVWVCHFGANLPCLEKADRSETPTSAMATFCQENPGAENIPAVVIGRATLFEWGCEAEEPTVGQQIFESDPQGYLAEFWYEVTPNDLTDTAPVTTEEPTEEIAQSEPTTAPVEEAVNESAVSSTADESPTNDYMPVSPLACQAIQEAATEVLATSFELELSVPFEDPFTGKAGLGCRLTTTGTGTDFPFPRQPLNDLADAFDQWTLLLSHQADGPTGGMMGLRNDLAFMLISSDWEPAPDAECPSDQPISLCELTADQQLYTVNIWVARDANETIIESADAEQYIPVPSAVCQSIQEIANKTLSTSFEMEASASFTDPQSGETGLGCSLTAAGTEADFLYHPNLMLIELSYAFDGWTEKYGYAAGGPRGGATGLTNNTGLMLISAVWEPAQGVECPTDQPLSACELTPEQKLYTVEIKIAQK